MGLCLGQIDSSIVGRNVQCGWTGSHHASCALFTHHVLCVPVQQVEVVVVHEVRGIEDAVLALRDMAELLLAGRLPDVLTVQPAHAAAPIVALIRCRCFLLEGQDAGGGVDAQACSQSEAVSEAWSTFEGAEKGKKILSPAVSSQRHEGICQLTAYGCSVWGPCLFW